MVYLNHGAVTYPKPNEVITGVVKSLTEPPWFQYRSVQNAGASEHVITLCRKNLASLFHVSNPKRIFFTSGATQALNTILLGLNYKKKRIVITATEHNSVLRTVIDGMKERIKKEEIELVIVPCDSSGYVDINDMRNAINNETALVLVNHSSNVTGAVQDIEAMGDLAKAAGAYFAVDASQSAGTIPINAEEMNIDMLAFTAQKGLFGIEGCGGFYLKEGINLKPLMYGGTGTDSKTMIPDPDKAFYEVGTGNITGITALNAGVEFILETGMDAIRKKESCLMAGLYEGLSGLRGVVVYASRKPEGTALSFNITGLSCSDVGYILSGTYNIVVRTGFHCAPYIHKYLGTEKEGTVRVSISYMTEESDINYFLGAVREITESLK